MVENGPSAKNLRRSCRMHTDPRNGLRDAQHPARAEAPRFPTRPIFAIGMQTEASKAKNGLHVLDDDLHITVDARDRTTAYRARRVVRDSPCSGHCVRHGTVRLPGLGPASRVGAPQGPCHAYRPCHSRAPDPIQRRKTIVGGAFARKVVEPIFGIEPKTYALRKRCSTAELNGR